MALAFDEVRLDNQIAEGAIGGPGYNTVVVTTAAGSEQRIPLQSVGRLRWEISSGLKNPTQFALLIAFFRARQGKTRGFRYMDWSDYTATLEPIVNPGGTTLQLIKTYSDTANSEVRKIVKPVAAGFQLYKNAVLMGSGYTLDATTGIVTLSLSAAGAAFTWSGTFDTPVRFDTDQMRFTNDAALIRVWDQIPIVELLY